MINRKASKRFDKQRKQEALRPIETPSVKGFSLRTAVPEGKPCPVYQRRLFVAHSWAILSYTCGYSRRRGHEPARRSNARRRAPSRHAYYIVRSLTHQVGTPRYTTATQDYMVFEARCATEQWGFLKAPIFQPIITQEMENPYGKYMLP